MYGPIEIAKHNHLYGEPKYGIMYMWLVKLHIKVVLSCAGNL